jgi:hypothetical protein
MHFRRDTGDIEKLADWSASLTNVLQLEGGTRHSHIPRTETTSARDCKWRFWIGSTARRPRWRSICLREPWWQLCAVERSNSIFPSWGNHFALALLSRTQLNVLPALKLDCLRHNRSGLSRDPGWWEAVLFQLIRASRPRRKASWLFP